MSSGTSPKQGTFITFCFYISRFFESEAKSFMRAKLFLCRRTSQPTSKRAKTLEEIIELARRKSSCNYEEPSPQKHYVAANDDKLPVEEPAIRASEIVENNDDWIYLEQLMELDADRISLSGEPPITIDNDDDTSSTPGRRMCFNPSFS
ncbi:Methyl-CpG-binding domain-containing protein [Dirofilaria immitis]